MPTQPLGLGFVGCGASLPMYGPALQYLSNARAVAWMDPDESKTKAAVEQYGGTGYTDFEKFLSCPDLNAVVIVSPPWLHYPQAEAAAKAGKHVLCEKPMGRTVEECRKMIEAVEGRNLILQIGFMKRFNPWFMKVKSMIESGELGTVFEVKIDWSWPQYQHSGWRDKRENWGGLFFDHGSHTIDLCRWWLGEIEQVHADARILLAGREVEDFTQAVYRHAGGALSTHSNSRMTHRPLIESYTVEGSKCTVTLECEHKWSFLSVEPFVMKKYVMGHCDVMSPESLHTWSYETMFQASWMYLGSLRHFCSAIESGKQPAFCSGTDGLKTTETINATYIAAHEKRTVNLPLKDPYDPEKIFTDWVAQSPGIKV